MGQALDRTIRCFEQYRGTSYVPIKLYESLWKYILETGESLTQVDRCS